MGYQNPHSAGYQVERLLSGEYNIGSHSDIGAFYNSVAQVDRPQYTQIGYYPSEADNFSEFKYDRIQIGYDPDLKAAKDNVRGPPMEAYIPPSFVAPDGAGKAVVEVMPQQTIVDEILKAQAEVLGKKEKMKDVKAIRLTEIEQEIRLRRRIRKVEILRK